jgi:predicted porin
MDYQLVGTGTSQTAAVANATRTSNVMKWDSPNWGGFTATAAYSTSPLSGAFEGDMAVIAATQSSQSGSGLNLAAAFNASNWGIRASMWDAKAEATNTLATATEQSSISASAYMRFGGFKVGVGMNQAELTSNATVISDRTNLTVPVSYTTGAHNFYAHYTMAGDDDAAQFSGLDTKAKMMAFAYVYDLSKRTSVGITYAQIDNGVNANYQLFTGSSLGSPDSAPGRGEDPRIIQGTLRHAF